MSVHDFPPAIPPRLEHDSLDTTWEFALKNFPGWWDKMLNLGFSELELIDYTSGLRERLA